MKKEPLEFQKLSSMSKAELFSCWPGVFGTSAPRGASASFLRTALAWKLQVLELGVDTRKLERRLQQIAAALAAGRTPRMIGGGLGPKAGTTIARTWRGKVYTVTVVADGFEYGGKAYASLSEIAREITGTRWNGPAFFGLRKAKTPKAAGASHGK